MAQRGRPSVGRDQEGARGARVRQKLADSRRADLRRARRMRVAAVLTAAAALAAVGVGIGFAVRSAPAPAADSVELAPANTTRSGAAVDGISSGAMEQTYYHIHAHLAVYVNGQAKVIPAGIGIVPPWESDPADSSFIDGGSAIYWLHTHDDTGVLHVESPTERVYTLGNFFDIWQQPLGPDQVGPARGRVTAYVDGRPFTGDPRTIPLQPHEVIQLDVGQDVAPKPYTFPSGL